MSPCGTIGCGVENRTFDEIQRKVAMLYLVILVIILELAILPRLTPPPREDTDEERWWFAIK